MGDFHRFARLILLFLFTLYLMTVLSIGLLLLSTILSKAYASDYSEALSKTKDAALVATGAKDAVAKLGAYAKDKAYRYLSKEVVDGTFVAYYIAKNKSIETKPFKSFLLPSAQHSLSIDLNRVKLITSWNF